VTLAAFGGPPFPDSVHGRNIDEEYPAGRVSTRPLTHLDPLAAGLSQLRPRRDPRPASPYIASGAEIPSSPSAAASVSCVARTSVSRAAERSGSAGSTTRASR
jgi:hypothetical protein